MDNNVPKTIETHNIPDTDNVPGIVKTINNRGANPLHVNVRIDREVWKRIKIMSIKDNVPVSDLVNEALATWVRWLAKAAREEAKEEDREEIDREYVEAGKMLQQLKINSHMAMMREAGDRKFHFAIRSARNWERMYPGKPWPGKLGLGRHRKERPEGWVETRGRKKRVVGVEGRDNVVDCHNKWTEIV